MVARPHVQQEQKKKNKNCINWARKSLQALEPPAVLSSHRSHHLQCGTKNKSELRFFLSRTQLARFSNLPAYLGRFMNMLE